jgi:hypothetical protein
LIVTDLCYNFLDVKVGSAENKNCKDETSFKATFGLGTTSFPANISL